jgi:hypothetical protein
MRVNVGDLVSKFPIVFLAILLVSSLIVVISVTLHPPENDLPETKFYEYPLSVTDNTYIVTVRSNYTSAPEVSYLEVKNSISVDFRGNPENAFCNITIPADLICGEFTVIDKYYTMNEEDYTQSTNSTHNSFYFTFNHIAYTKHFEIIGANRLS